MSSQSTLSIRISADTTQAASAIRGATQSVQNLGVIAGQTSSHLNALNSATHTTSAGIVLTGNAAVQANSRLQQLAGGANQVTTSMHSMTAAMGTSAQSSARWVQELNNSTRAAQQAANANEQLHRSNTSLVGSFGSLNSVLGAFGIAVGAVGLAQLAKDILKTNIEMEQLRARLDAASSSLASSKAAFAMILQIAKETPQSISEITKAYTMMKNFGLDPNEKAMRGFTDVASKLGGSVDTLTGIIRAFGQANGKAALHAQDTNQLIERGVPVYGLLVKVLNKSTAEIMKMMEAGELGRDTMEKLRQELFKWADGSSAKMMDTLGGSIEGLSSAWKNFEDTLLNSKAENLLKNSVQFMGAYLDWLSAKMADSPIDKKIAELQEKLANPKRSFISIGLQSLGVIDTPDSIKTQIAALQKEKLDSEKALAADKKQIQDQANGEKLAAEMATNKAIENGDTDALKKYMTAKLEAIKSTDKEIIRQQAELASIPAKLATAIVAVESTGKMEVNKTSGAAGLMQVMPANYQKQGYTQAQMLTDSSISVKAGLKVWQDSMDESKKAVVKGTIDAGQIFDYASALYTTKHQTIIDRIKKNGGVFDINLFKEASDWANKVKAGMSLQNVSENDIFAPYKKSANEAAQATKHLATEAENAAKKIADNDRQLTQGTAFGKYNATIDELTEAHKRYIDTQGKSGISQATYSQGIDNANETLLKNTDYVVANAKALEAQAKARDKYLGHIGDYNSTIDELTRNKQRGAITQGEYGLGVANANAGLMNQVTDKQINPKNVGEVIDAQNANESEKALAKLNDQATKTIDSFNQLGDSGKMAFDGILGGISAVASAATNFGEVMTKLNDSHADYAKNYQAFIEDSKNSEADKAKAKINFEKENAAYQSKSFQAEISGARQIAGATAKLFGEKSAARKAFHAIEMGMSLIEMAMAAKKMVVDVAAGAANMFAQSGWAGFAGVAAMAAVMGGLGFAMSGGSKPAIDNTVKATSEKGTILGSPDSTSNSIKDIIDTLNSISDKEYPELKAISDGFRGVDNSMYKLNQLMAQSTANFTNTQNIGVPSQATGAKAQSPVTMKDVALSAATSVATVAATTVLATASLAPVVATAVAGTLMTSIAIASAAQTMGLSLVILGLQYGLGKLLGVGKVTYTQIGEGIVIQSGKLLTDGMISAVNAQTWRKDEQKIKQWFGSKKTVIETYGQLSDDIYDSLNANVTSITKSIFLLTEMLDLNDMIGTRITTQDILPFLKIDWYAQKAKGEDVGKLMADQLNAWYDRIAQNVFKNVLGEFQKVGEGMLQTAGRLVIQMNVVKASYERIGLNVGDASVGLAGFSDRLIQMYNSSADAKDGLKNFIDVMNEVYNVTKSQGQKSQDTITDTRTALSKSGYDVNDMLDEGKVRAAYLDLQSKAADAALKAKDAEDIAKSLSDAAVSAFNPISNMPNTMVDIIEGYKKGDSQQQAWKNALGVSDVNQATWSTVPENWKNTFNTSSTPVFQQVKAWLDGIESVQAQGQAGIAGTDITSLQQQEEKLAAAKETSELAAATAKSANSVAGTIGSLLDKTIPKMIGLQEQFFKQSLNGEQMLAYEREKTIKKEYAGMTESFENDATLKPIIDAMKETGKYTKYTAEELQRFVWSLEDVAKASNKLKDAGKYLTDFSKSISDWIKGLKATQIGTPETQFTNAQSNFEEQIKIAKFSSSAEDKRAALSSITNFADTYLNAIKNYYGSGVEAQGKIKDVLDAMSGLEKSVSIEDLQLGVLEEIRNGVYKFQDGLGAIEAVIKSAKTTYDATPTVENNLKLNALANIGLTMDKFVTAGANKETIDTLLTSITSKEGLIAKVDMIVTSKDFAIADKKAMLDSLISNMGTLTLPINALVLADGAESPLKIALAGLTGLETKINAVFKDSTPEQQALLQTELDKISGLKTVVNNLALNPDSESLKTLLQKGIADLGDFDAKTKLSMPTIGTDIAGAIAGLGTISVAINNVALGILGTETATKAFKDLKDLEVTVEKALLSPDLTDAEKSTLNSQLKNIKSLELNIARLSLGVDNEATKTAVNAQIKSIGGFLGDLKLQSPTLDATFRDTLQGELWGMKAVDFYTNPTVKTTEEQALRDAIANFTAMNVNVGTVLKDATLTADEKIANATKIANYFGDNTIEVTTILKSVDAKNKETVRKELNSFYTNNTKNIMVSLEQNPTSFSTMVTSLVDFATNNTKFIKIGLEKYADKQEETFVQSIKDYLDLQSLAVKSMLSKPVDSVEFTARMNSLSDTTNYLKTLISSPTNLTEFIEGLKKDANLTKKIDVKTGLLLPENISGYIDSIVLSPVKLTADKAAVDTTVNYVIGKDGSVGKFVNGSHNGSYVATLTSSDSTKGGVDAANSYINTNFTATDEAVLTALYDGVTTGVDAANAALALLPPSQTIDINLGGNAQTEIAALLKSYQDAAAEFNKFGTPPVSPDTPFTQGDKIKDAAKPIEEKAAIPVEEKAVTEKSGITPKSALLDSAATPKDIRVSGDAANIIAIDVGSDTGFVPDYTQKQETIVDNSPKFFTERYSSLRDKSGNIPASSLPVYIVEYFQNHNQLGKKQHGDLSYIKDSATGLIPHYYYKGTSGDVTDKAIPDSKMFATGGAFTNGVVSKPTTFDMGLMGEAGSEAIMPLTSVGGSLGVKAIADSSVLKSIETLRADLANKNDYIILTQNAVRGMETSSDYRNLLPTTQDTLKAIYDAAAKVNELKVSDTYSALSDDNKKLISDLAYARSTVNAIRTSDNYAQLQSANFALCNDLTTSKDTLDKIQASDKYKSLSVSNQALVTDLITSNRIVSELSPKASYKELGAANFKLVVDLAAAQTTVKELELSSNYAELDAETKALALDLGIAKATLTKLQISNDYVTLQSETENMMKWLKKSAVVVSKSTESLSDSKALSDIVLSASDVSNYNSQIKVATDNFVQMLVSIVENATKGLKGESLTPSLGGVTSVSSVAVDTTGRLRPEASKANTLYSSLSDNYKSKYSKDTFLSFMDSELAGVGTALINSYQVNESNLMAAVDYAKEAGKSFGTASEYFSNGQSSKIDSSTVAGVPLTKKWSDIGQLGQLRFKTKTGSELAANDELTRYVYEDDKSTAMYYVGKNDYPSFISRNLDDRLFAKGGIANQPSIFGEAGAEAAVPLPDGRTIPVTLHREAANDSRKDNAETIAELKKQNDLLEENNRQLQALIKTMQAGIQQSANDSEEQTRELKTIARRVMS